MGAVVLILPAMGVTATYYRPLAHLLVDAGFAVAVAELRGHGQSAIRARRGVDWGYRELVEVDLPATLDAVRWRFGQKPVYVLGHSLGGQIACLHAAAFPGEIDGVVLIASCTLHYRCWRFPHNLGVLVFTQFVGLLSRLLGYFPGKQVRFAGREGRQQMIDWAANGRHGRWTVAGSAHDYESLLSTVAIPVLAMSIAGDNYAPSAAVDNQVAKMPQAAVARHHWTAADLDRGGLHHFRWVRHSRPIVEKLVGWIEPTRSAD